MFGTPKNQPEFGIPQPDIGFSLPTTTPPIIAQAPQDKGGWNDWMTNWNLQRSDLGDLPEYPQANDPFALGKQTGDMIRKTWHDVHKDYAFNTIQENFPSFGAPEPQPDESYHGYFDRVGQKVQETNPYQLATMRRFSADEQPINLAQSQPAQPEAQSPFMEGDTGLPQYNINDDFSASVQGLPNGKWIHTDKAYPGYIKKTTRQAQQNDVDFSTTLQKTEMPDDQKAMVLEIRKYENPGAGPEDYKLHHPKGKYSGPTMGMGSDFGQPHRSSPMNEQQALNAGFNPKDAKIIGGAANKRGYDSADYVMENRDWMDAPTHEQAINLMRNDEHFQRTVSRVENIAKTRDLDTDQKSALAQMLYNSGTLSGNKAFSDAIKNDDGVSASAAVEDFLNQSAGNKKAVREAHPEVERRMYEGLDKLFPQKEEEE